jgi:alkanesulfonate monooxygenase SsuD/methylene tetrahydromethanopterin reductase-like flavin-dependent oxidoreductase (luciferase family)
MSGQLSLGAIFRPQLPPERLHSAVLAAERTGLDELWLWEDCFLESGIATATAALAWSDDLTIGIGLLPVPLRNVAITAMELATLDRLFPGRLRIAVGHGVQDWMGQAGAKVASPLGLMREYVTALRELLSGGIVTTHGEYVSLTDVQLGWPPHEQPAILVGGVGPRTMALGGEVADGILIDSATTAEGIREALTLMDPGWRAAGRTGAPIVAAYTRTFGVDDVEFPADYVARDVNDRHLAGATSVILQPSAGTTDIESYFAFIEDEIRPRVHPTPN